MNPLDFSSMIHKIAFSHKEAIELYDIDNYRP